MKLRQWEIWKAKVEGIAVDHWFILISGQERLDSSHYHQINGLMCSSFRGEPSSIDVRLNAADGFAAPTVCQCDLVWLLDKRKLHAHLGTVSWERQQAIKSRFKEILRFY